MILFSEDLSGGSNLLKIMNKEQCILLNLAYHHYVTPFPVSKGLQEYREEYVVYSCSV